MSCSVTLHFVVSWHQDLTLENASSPYSHYVPCNGLWNQWAIEPDWWWVQLAIYICISEISELRMYFKWWTDCLLEDESDFPFSLLRHPYLIVSELLPWPQYWHILPASDLLWTDSCNFLLTTGCFIIILLSIEVLSIARRWRSCDLLIRMSGRLQAWGSECGWGLLWTGGDK